MELTEVKQERKYCGRLGWALVAVILCILVWSGMLSAASNLLMTHIVTDDKLANLILGSIVAEMLGLFGMVGHYIIALPVAWRICRPVPRTMLQKNKVGPGKMLRWFVIGSSLMHIGGIIGTSVNNWALKLTGREPVNIVGDMMELMPMTVAIIGTCVLAPICEEILFRGLFANRLARYGERSGALVSAILFGLYHANLEQFFYAFVLGILLAYVYYRSGSLIAPIALHMLLNIYGSGIPLLIGENESLMVLFSLMVIIMLVAGIVLLIRGRKHQVWAAGECIPTIQIVFCNVGMVVAIIGTLALFVVSFVLM